MPGPPSRQFVVLSIEMLVRMLLIVGQEHVVKC